MGKIGRRCWELLALLAVPAILGLMAASLEIAAALLLVEMGAWLLARLLRWMKPLRRLSGGLKRLFGWIRRQRPWRKALLLAAACLGMAFCVGVLQESDEAFAGFLMFEAIAWLTVWFFRRIKLGTRLASLFRRLFGWIERLKQPIKNAVLVVLSVGTTLCLICQLWEALTWMVLLDIAAALIALGLWLYRWILDMREKSLHLCDLSLQATYVFYVVATLVAATVLCIFTVAGIDWWRTQFISRYDESSMVFVVPEGGRAEVEAADGEDGMGLLVIRDSEGRMVRQLEVDMINSSIGYFYDADEHADGSSDEWYPYYNKVYIQPVYSSADRALNIALGVLMLLSIPLIYVGAVVCCAMAFYRRKLLKPIAILSDAADRIAGNSLDFHVEYGPKDEMGRLCESFEKMRGALERNNEEMWRQMEERRRLNAAFSHDLRTPLTVLKGHTEMLRTGLPEASIGMEEALQELDAMSGSIVRLENYVSAMSRLQRLEDVEIHIEAVQALSFAQELRESAAILCGDRLSLQVTPGMVWLMDPEVVMQVIENLLANAVRYARSRVTLGIEESAGKLNITVGDDGPGFSQRDLEKATEPFYRGERDGQGHLGLGLNICRILCERHGGGISVGNGAEGGAEVKAWIALGER